MQDILSMLRDIAAVAPQVPVAPQIAAITRLMQNIGATVDAVYRPKSWSAHRNPRNPRN